MLLHSVLNTTTLEIKWRNWEVKVTTFRGGMRHAATSVTPQYLIKTSRLTYSSVNFMEYHLKHYKRLIICLTTQFQCNSGFAYLVAEDSYYMYTGVPVTSQGHS